MKMMVGMTKLNDLSLILHRIYSLLINVQGCAPNQNNNTLEYNFGQFE